MQVSLAMKGNDLRLGRNLARLVSLKLTSRADLAAAMGISVQAVGQLIRGETKGLKPNNLVRASACVKLSERDLVETDLERLDEGEIRSMQMEWMKLFQDGPSDEPGIAEASAAYRDVVSIRQLDVRASMGLGVDAPDHVDVVKMIQVSLPDLRRALPTFTKPQNLAILTGYGDSMQPTFNDGDPLIVDTGVKEVTVDGVYVMEREGPAGWELFVKRLQRQLDGTLLMISDNPQYKPQHITEELRGRFKVSGRAIGVWKFGKL